MVGFRGKVRLHRQTGEVSVDSGLRAGGQVLRGGRGTMVPGGRRGRRDACTAMVGMSINHCRWCV